MHSRESSHSAPGNNYIPIPAGRETSPPPDSQHSTIGRLLSESHKERRIIALATVALIISTLSTLAIPSFFGRVIDTLTITGSTLTGAKRQKLIAETSGLIIVSLVNAVFSFFRGYLFNYAGERIVARLRKRLFSSLLAQETGFFDQSQTGDLVSRISGDTSVLRDAVTGNISMALRLSATIIGGILYLFIVSWKLTLAVLAVVPAVAIAARFYGAYTRRLSKETRAAIAESTSVAEETLSAMRTVRSFANEPLQQSLFDVRIDHSFELGLRSAMASALFSGCTTATVAVAFVGILFYGGTLVIDGEITPGVLASFLLYAFAIGGG